MTGDLPINSAPTPCPSCGHCPTCGRGPSWPVYFGPYWGIPTTSPQWTNVTSGTVICDQGFTMELK